jgi:hypothetical protein
MDLQIADDGWESGAATVCARHGRTLVICMHMDAAPTWRAVNAFMLIIYASHRRHVDAWWICLKSKSMQNGKLLHLFWI